MPRSAAVACLALTLGAAAAGCGAIGTTTTATTGGATTTAPAATLALTIYPVSGGVVVPRSIRVTPTRAVAAASLHALGIDAPVAIENGTATVDLADATPDEVAEIVFTLTQFRSVTAVDVAGKTQLTRDDEAQYAPQILVDAPAAGAEVPLDIPVAGTAQVFEATFVLELRQGGSVVDRQTVTASAGAPERGFFTAALHASGAGAAAIVAYEPSAKDGTPLHRVEIPVTVVP